MKLDPNKPLDTVKVSCTLQSVVNYSEIWFPDPTEITFQIYGTTYVIDPTTNMSVKSYFPLHEAFVVRADMEEMITAKHYFHLDDSDRGMQNFFGYHIAFLHFLKQK